MRLMREVRYLPWATEGCVGFEGNVCGRRGVERSLWDPKLTVRIIGIDVVRNRIKGFAQKKVTLPPGRQKLVILDEADR